MRSVLCSTKLKSPVKMVVCVLWSDLPTNFSVEYRAFVVLVMSRLVVDVDDLEGP